MSDRTLEQFQLMLQENRRLIEASMRQTIEDEVKAHVTRLETRLETHLRTIEPFLSGVKGIKFFGGLALWIAGFVVTVGGAIQVVKLFLK